MGTFSSLTKISDHITNIHYYDVLGDVIAVVGQMNSNGYYTAIFDGKHGLVPASFVEEMKLSDKEAEQRLLNQVSKLKGIKVLF